LASFTWLDFSERDKQRALDVLDQFREKGTVDELGLGSVRDRIADILFPGTSTIMTRARYYLFVPWMYRQLESKKVSSSEVARSARRAEVALIEALLADGDANGLIGKQARSQLKRLPSTIYWQGLGVLGIRRFEGSREMYHRALDRLYAAGGDVIRGDDGHAVVGGRRFTWDPQLPAAPKEFPRSASLALSAKEAEYLQEQIIQSAPDSLFAHLATNLEVVEDVNAPWHLPLRLNGKPALERSLTHAQNFSEVMHGVALSYNLMLAELSRKPPVIELYDRRIASWAVAISARRDELASWSLRDFWMLIDEQGRQITEPTREFIEWWIGITRAGPLNRLSADPEVRRRIHARERRLKGPLARLDNARALEMWGQASSADPFDFRWNRPTRTVLADIKSGLGVRP